MKRALSVSAAGLLLLASYLASPPSAGASPVVSVKTPLAVSTHGHASVVVKSAYAIAAGLRATRSTIAVYRGSKRVAAGTSASLTLGAYTEITSVSYQHQIITHPLKAVVSTITTPVQTPVVSSVYTPGKYETVTCTVTSMGPTTYTNNYPDMTSYEWGTLTGSCTSPDFPGETQSDFELWGYNDEQPLSGELIAPVNWAVQAPTTYQADILFFGDYQNVTTYTTSYLTSSVTTYVPTTVVSWSPAVTFVGARRNLTVSR